MSMTLRWYVAVVFIGAVVGVTAVAAGIGVAVGMQDLRDSTVERQAQSGAGAANGVEFYVTSAGRSLLSASSLLDESAFRPDVDRDSVGTLLDPLVAYSQEFSHVLLVDGTGEVVLTRPLRSPWSAVSFAEDAASLRAATHAQPHLSLTTTLGAPYWAVPVLATVPSDEPYVLIGVLNPVRLQDILFANLPIDAEAALVGQDGEILAATGRQTPAGTDVRLLAESDGGQTAEDSIVTTSSLSSLPAYILVESSSDQLTVMKYQLIRNAVVLAVSLAATGVVVGLVAARRITHPVTQIRHATRRMHDGDLTARARPAGALELRQLADDFNAMAVALGHDRAELVALHGDLERRVQERTAQVRTQQAEMEQFFYGVSHDVKNPVLAISNFAQLAEEALGESRLNRRRLQDHLARVRRSARNLEVLVSDLLQFARASRLRPKAEPFTAASVVHDVVDEIRPFADEKRVRLRADGPAVRLDSDAARLRHIVMNLVQNAVKYMPEDRHPGHVDVTWSREDGGLRLTVRDDGAGIPETEQARLFQPFYRPPSAGHDGGTGLGLSIVRRLVESLGGLVTLRSRPGEGSTFHVWIPRTPPEPEGPVGS